jgi:mono/diheme cytochrome c family protein
MTVSLKRQWPITLATCLVICVSAEIAAADDYQEHDYLLNCAGCHRIDGSGSNAVPSLHRIKELGEGRDVRAYLIRVPGVAQAPLSDARLAAMMNWLVKRFSGRAPSPRYTASEVSELRRSPFLNPLAARRELD